MLRVVATIVLLAGCYQDPDYSGTHFKCDATHPCPHGQSCVAGTCTGGGSGLDGSSGGQEGVDCGGTTCTGGDSCCVDFVNAPHCISSGSSCSGLSASCDGIEDCSGSPCCSSGTHASCGTSCSSKVCRDAADCAGGGGAVCCPSPVGAPWGQCQPAC